MPDLTHRCRACRQDNRVFPFTMAFQPVIDLDQGRIDAHEALVRGPANESAGTVLGQLNETNLYAFDQACRVKAIEMAARLGLDSQLNINFLPNAVYEPRACIRLTLDAAARTGFPLNRLTFEFTENEGITDERHVQAIIAEYHRHGFRVALDDFGTSYSGLSRLAQLRPDIIKLDRALVTDCDTDRIKLAVVASMVRLGADTGIKVVAEGMEQRAEVDALRQAGIRFMQGYYFSRPVFEGLASEADIVQVAGSVLNTPA